MSQGRSVENCSCSSCWLSAQKEPGQYFRVHLPLLGHGDGLEAFRNLGWGAVDALASPRLRFHVDFNFSSTYSESSIMRSANCSAGRPAKFLSTNSFT
jgi:hypothetical protein